MTITTADPTAPVAEVRAAFGAWMAEHAAELEPFRTKEPHDIDEAWTHFRVCMRLLWDDGWTKLGWPVDCGGLGGSAVARAAVLEDLAGAGYVIPEFISTTEIIGPMLVRFAPHLAVTDVAGGVRGDHGWCQGFSEPDAGSDLGSLRTRAVPDGDGWRLTGQKMWSSLAHVADKCCVLARTGDADSGYRGLTMFWVDMDAPGVDVVPTACATDRHETSEIFFDGVVVPGDRVVGAVGDGWKVVMYLLQFERGGYAWQRQADLHTMLQAIVTDAPRPYGANAPDLVGSTYVSLLGLRALAADTTARLATGADLGPETSVGKVLLGLTEQYVTDLARTLFWPALELDEDDDAEMWRRRWSYARVTTVFGGTAEVQRDLIAERLLGLPPGAVMDAEELDLVRTSVLALLGTTPAADVPTALLDLGWSELLEAEPAGATTALAESQGRVLAPTPALDLVVLHAAGLALDGTTAVVHPPMRRTLEPAVTGGVVDGLVLAGAERAERFVAPSADGLVELAAGAVTLTPVRGADPDLGLARASGSAAGAGPVATTAPWDDVVAAARRHLAAELVGVAEQMLDDAVAYVQARHQFGRPIGVFQTVKHRLADVKVGVDTARAVLGAAWQDGTGTTAIAAKVLAATAHRLASAHGQQVQGGIAFTTEHGFHRFIERGRVLDGLYGRSDDLLHELGRQLLDSGTVPRTPQLVEAGVPA